MVNWFGVEMEGAFVRSLWLPFNQLSGTIPSSLGNLTHLYQLALSQNQLSGSIPASLGNLTNLGRLLDLNTNQLSGTIPSTLGNLTKLNWLNLSYNQLSGSLPSNLGNMTNLKELSLNDNQITESIPSSLGLLSQLNTLNLGANQLNGSIPSSLGNATQLENLQLYNNKISGIIPPSFGNLTQLKNLILFKNQLSGGIPSSLGNLNKMFNLWLDDNQLSGPIPSTFDNLSALTSLHLSNNKFTFDGMELVAAKFQPTYSPQADISLLKNNDTLLVSAGGTLSNNTYNWYSVNGMLDTTITGDSTFIPSADGRYYVDVTNSIATRLTLHSDTIEFTKEPSRTVYYHLQNHNNLFRDSIGTSNITDVKVAADSSSETLVKVKTQKADQCILRVKEDLGPVYDKPGYGYFIPYKRYSDSVLYFYHHPSNGNLETNQYSRPIHFEVFDTIENVVKLSNQVEVVRPPLLLAHGVFGTGESTFGNMRRKLITDNLYRAGQITAIDYPNDRDFVFAVNFLRSQKDSALNTALHTEKILCSKLDVGGHSMGGLILRKYLHSYKYNNDINKYVSLNTPHSGSQIANFVFNTEWIWPAVIYLWEIRREVH